MTLDDVRTTEDLKALEVCFITPKVAARFMKCDPHEIRLRARECPERLGYDVDVYKSRVRINRLSFIDFLEGKRSGNKCVY